LMNHGHGYESIHRKVIVFNENVIDNKMRLKLET
jgi:hypothetical protein